MKPGPTAKPLKNHPEKKTPQKTLAGPASAWLLQSAPGLALLLKKELVRAGAIDRQQNLLIKRQRNHDLIFINRVKSDAVFLNLRIAESVLQCPVFGRYKISQTQLKSLADVLRPLGPRRLVVNVAGRVFDRRDISRWIEKELEARDYKFSDDVEDEIWMFCIDESYYFGIPRAKGRELREAERLAERPGSLPPPVAAAMAFAGQPRDTDVVLDPVCGSGTLLSEVLAYAPGVRRIGCDIDPEAIKVARANVRLNDGDQLLQHDSRQLSKLDLPQPTLVLANLPFGRQYGEKSSNPALYRAILREAFALARDPAVKRDWRAVVLTSDVGSLDEALKGSSLTRQDLFRVRIRGELAVASLLKAGS